MSIVRFLARPFVAAPPSVSSRDRRPAPSLLGAVLLLVSTATLAQPTTGLEGRVLAHDGRPVAGAVVRCYEIDGRTTSSSDGSFRFAPLLPGHYSLDATHPRAGSGRAEVDVVEGAVARLELRVDPLRHEDEIVVSASPEVRGRDELYQAASVLDDRDLARVLAPSLGETLAGEPGVRSTWFGPGSSRPVIRGLGGDRVRLMENGLEIGDASSASPDHAVALDPLAAERIEVVRGPATLTYGSNAIGGVVNVLDNRVPSVVPDNPVTGSLLVGGASADERRSGAVALDGGARRFAWHLDASARSSDDVDTPDGELVNSWTDAASGAVGFSYVGEDGFAGLSYAGMETEYGSPAEEEVSIDLELRRWDARGEIRNVGRAFRALRFRAGGSDYSHVEYEGDEVGTRFLNDQWEARVDALHAPVGRLTGSFGAQHVERDFAAIGDESFVPPTTTRTTGLFVFEEAEWERDRLQFGARWDTRTVDCGDCGDDRNFNGVSASVGWIHDWENGVTFSVNVARAEKLPSSEELFSEGPHLATGTYERGDPELDPEESLGLELGLHVHRERWALEASVFRSRFDDFIRESATGEVEDGLPVYQWTQGDALFTGGELHGHFDVLHAEPRHVRIEWGLDVVEAERDDGTPLPRIPPHRATLGVRYEGPVFWALVQGGWTAEQDEVDDFETPTDGYFMLDASLGWRFTAGATVHDVILAGTNLGDELARNHVSFLKDVAPLPGRSVALTYRLQF